MVKAKFLKTILCLGLLMTGSSHGQDTPSDRRLIGPTAGIAYGFDRADVPVFGGSVDCGLFSSGRGVTPSVGGILKLPSFFSSALGLSASVSLSRSSGTLTAPPVNQVWILHPDTREALRIQEEYRLNRTSWIASCDLLAEVGLSDRLKLGAGAFAGHRLSSTFSQTENILEPEDFRLSNGQREALMADGSNPESAALSFGPSIAAAYSIPLGPRRYFVPGLSFRADMLSSVRAFSWKSYQVGATMSLLFDVTPATGTPPPPLPPEPVAPPGIPVLTASIEMYGVDDESNSLPDALIHVHETRLQQHVPVVPAVFFEHEASELPDRYATLDRARAEDFSADELVGTKVLEMQHQVLNILGMRMKEGAGSAITLTGSVSGDEAPELARARAETVRSYLTDVWKIDPARVKTAAGGSVMERSSEETEDGRSDNRRVEIASADPALLAPVTTEQMIRDFDPPMIRLLPRFRAEAGVKEWSIVITQGEREVVRYGGDRGDSMTRMSDTWQIDHERIDSMLSPLMAALVVTDSTGAVARAETTLPMTMVLNPRVVDQRVERSGDRARLVTTLVGFEFSSAEPGTQNRRALESIAGAVKDGAEVSLMGYTDRIGDQEHNRSLAAERAANAAAMLQALLKERGVKGVTMNVRGEGIETERFDNDLPEGRFLSRGVGIVVEQNESGASKP